MNTKKLAVAAVGGVATLALIGVGAGASFTDKAVAAQNIVRGSINLQLATDATNYAKSVQFADAGPLNGSAQTVSKVLYIRNTGSVAETLGGIGCVITGADVTGVSINGTALPCTDANGNVISTGTGIAGTIAVGGNSTTQVTVTYTVPESNLNFGTSQNPATPGDRATAVSLAIHATG